MKLHFAPGLSLPVEAVTQTFGFVGKRGSGKTYGALKLAELFLGADAQVVAIDPVGKWWSLRLGADGKKGFDIPVLGGHRGDLPLEPAAGALIADLGEVKLRCPWAALIIQLYRYVHTGKIRAIVVATCMLQHHRLPKEILGVPVHVVYMGSPV